MYQEPYESYCFCAMCKEVTQGVGVADEVKREGFVFTVRVVWKCKTCFTPHAQFIVMYPISRGQQ